MNDCFDDAEQSHGPSGFISSVLAFAFRKHSFTQEFSLGRVYSHLTLAIR